MTTITFQEIDTAQMNHILAYAQNEKLKFDFSEPVYTAIIEKTPDNWYIGQCEQVPGALTQGRTIAEVKENLKEAIQLILESEREHRQMHESKKNNRRKLAVC